MNAPERATGVGTDPWLGRSPERVEDLTLLAGHGAFLDYLPVRPGTLHAAVLRSPHAHAVLVRVATDRAMSCPGVRAVLTGEDVTRWAQPFVVGVKQPMQHWPLAIDRVRYVGEPVAVVIAEDRARAEDALDAIDVDYDPLPVAVEIADAIAPGAPLLHPEVGSNIVSDRSFRYGDPETAFATAARRVAVTVQYPRNSCTPIECGAVLAEYSPGEGAYDVTSNFMGPFSLHTVMALALKVPATRLRHRCPRDSGGSFGVKQSVFPMVVLMCLAARKAGAPVKWVEDRLEHLTAATSATGRSSTLEAAVDPDGRIRALAYDQFDDVGGYLRAPEPATFYRMHGCLTGAYDIPHLAVRNRVVVTNRTPAGLVRGFGGPQVYFALERLMQRIAVELGLDPLDVYRRNFVPCDAFPFRAAAGALLDSGDYAAALDKALAEGGHDELLRRRDAARAEGRLYGIGFAAIVEPSISNMGYITTVLTAEQRARAGPKNGAIAAATVNVDPLGGVCVTIASAPAGQGHRTVCAQVVADVLGVRPEDVTVNTEFDTHKDAWSVAEGNYSSRFAGAVAGTVHLAATRLRDRLAHIAATSLDCESREVVFAGGRVHARTAPDRSLPFARVASAPHWAPALVPEGVGIGMRETVFWTPESLAAPDAEDHINTSAAYGFAFDLCGVEIDRTTGRVRIDRYVTCHDAGRLLNPALADGQVRGGFAQAVGAALMEEFRYGADGSFLSGTLADYLVPTACEIPDPVIVHLETPSPFTPLGAKGIGEGNSMSTPVCIANAVADALHPVVGTVDIRLPLTPGRVLDLLGIDDPPPSVAPTAPPATPARGTGRTMRMSGSVVVAARPEDVFRTLLDPDALARVIPGCHGLVETAPHRYAADVTIGVSGVKARYRAEIALDDVDAPRGLRLSGRGTSSLGTASGSGTVRLEAVDRGTRVDYDYAVDVGGKVAAVGSRLLDGAARAILAQLFERLGREAAGAVAPSPAPSSWIARILRWLGIGS
ncbi:MAG: molybdopterin-dependent oxidoreductase [Betaproteobacteria bacterium]|nr:molybdopterin-dependent oxidoreductase [Betaproteobacteria bacterium]